MSRRTSLPKSPLFIVLVILLTSLIIFLVLIRSLQNNLAYSTPFTNIGTYASTDNILLTQTAPLLPSETETAKPFISESPKIWETLPPLSTDELVPITNGNRLIYKIALTFDLCQTEGDLAGYDTGIVQVLNETQTPATFFVGGLWMRDHNAETLELFHNSLFELGNHSWSHLDFSEIAPDEMRNEILLTQQYMWNLLGWQTNLFRLPYGNYNDDVLKVIRESGLYTIQWDVESGDPDPNVDAESMSEWVLNQAKPGSIIIMHANGRGWHTAEALPGIIQHLREAGYTFVTITELLDIQKP